MEAVPTPLHPSRLDSEYQIIVILPVKKRHQALLTRKALIDEQVLLIMAHRITEIHVNDLPSVTFKLMDDNPTEILIVYGIVGTKRRGIIIEHHRLVLVEGIIGAKVVNERRNLSLILDVEGLNDVQAVAAWLSGHYPVDIGVIVHAYAYWGQRVHVGIGA